eukprot:CAMPEP_0168509356 /NCGR_PEP_ID=MMETSP0405-20121227/723_1 /TAXON_ID=498012 /ORGANISM="Trichosphaerium sp, Strain Am-I-7 wt" /LENGTH=105 /DNA_ID=CAMNT_0008526791 /DNA_START=56 /DNA_END=373 /DNA_ORIENTATION=-
MENTINAAAFDIFVVVVVVHHRDETAAVLGHVLFVVDIHHDAEVLYNRHAYNRDLGRTDEKVHGQLCLFGNHGCCKVGADCLVVEDGDCLVVEGADYHVMGHGCD